MKGSFLRFGRGFAVLVSLAFGAVLVVAAPVSSTGAARAASALPRAASPVGLWRESGDLVRWVAIKGGFEERLLTLDKMDNGCVAPAGDPTWRVYPIGKNLYRIAYHYWDPLKGGPGPDGKKCSDSWEAPKATVKIIVSATRMTLSCDNKPNRVCFRYTRVRPATTTSSAYRCTGGQLKLFDGMNSTTVFNGGTPPSFSTNGHAYCLAAISTYHWNNGLGKAPGTIGLGVVKGLGGAGKTLGPWPATGSPGNGGLPNALWTATLAAGGKPVVINGTYTCQDSDPASWAQNQATGGHGICTVYVRNAVRSG